MIHGPWDKQAIFGPGPGIPDSARKILTLLLKQVEE